MKVYYIVYTFRAKGRTDIAYSEELTEMEPLLWLNALRTVIADKGECVIINWKELELSNTLLLKLDKIEIDTDLKEKITKKKT